MNNKYSIAIETITPEKAKALLEQFPRNRKSSFVRVESYADIMKRGNWAPFSVIIIDEDGNTVDGHHRLEAVVKSGVNAELVVFRGLEKKFIPFIDTGRPRSAGDMLAFVEELDGISSYRDVAALARAVMYYDMRYNAKVIPPDSLAEFIIENKDAVKKALSDYRRIKPIGGYLSHGAALYVVRRENPTKGDLIEVFINQISLGENICSGMPAYAARNAIFTLHGRRGRGSVIWSESFYTILRAWSALNKNEKIGLIKLKAATMENILKIEVAF